MKELTGPFANDLTELYVAMATYDAQLVALENGIRAAAQERNLGLLVKYQAEKAAIPLIQKSIQRECDELARKRMEAIAREQVEAREAVFAELPRTELYTHPSDTGTTVRIMRAKI